MAIPTQPIGSIPSLPSLIEAARGCRSGRISEAESRSQHSSAVQDTIGRIEATGSKVAADGEQAKESFVVYPIHGLTNIAGGQNSISSRGWQARVVSPHNIVGRSTNDPKLKGRR